MVHIMTKFIIDLDRESQWYQVMAECRRCFGRQWRGQPRVRRKFRYRPLAITAPPPVQVWFEVPDPEFMTWIGIKTGCAVSPVPNK